MRALRTLRRTALALLAAAGLGLVPAALEAQLDVPSLGWKTLRTENFRIHYEPGLEGWATEVAEYMESVRTAVAARVGYTPPRIIDVLVEDPLNQPNGSAWPSLTYPGMRFWATPPSPSSGIGNLTGWGELLSVHEYAHVAHIMRPSREPLSMLTAITSMIPLGPIAMVPAWVTEGYATVIEGELTGSGRPNSANRAAIIRSLALEGYLPAYGELDATGRFNGGAMRYLIGSAYLEWLQGAHGDTVLPQLWRRATARKPRSFPAAFTATFGDSPDLLYGRFSAEVTRRAFRVRDVLQRQGLAQGTLVQQWNWSVGTPDVSPNGERLAVRRATPADPGGIFVFALAPDTAGARRDSTREAKRLKQDPEDLPTVRPYPRPLKRVAFLGPVAGVPFDAPRFFADGERLLVTRAVPLADGRARSDLFEWNSGNGKVRRITRGAGIQQADPTPDGKSAVGLTCGGGTCSLVTVDLASGAVRTLAAGGLNRSFSGARVSPDGRRVVTTQQDNGHWALTVITLADGQATRVGPRDGQSRHSATWENDSTIIAVSEASGVPVLERIPLGGGAVTVAARTLGATGSPEVGPDGRLWWLDLHGRGWNLRVNDANTAVPVGEPLDAADFPAARRIDASRKQTFAKGPVTDEGGYGRGPLGASFVSGLTYAADGETWTAGANIGDPLGRHSVLALAGGGRNGSWGGARLTYTMRRFRPELQLNGYTAEYEPSLHGRAGPGFEPFDAVFTGGSAALRLTRYGTHGSTTYRVGGGTGTQRNATLDLDAVTRTLGFAEISGSYGFTPKATRRVSTSYALQLSQGSTDGADWQRTVAEVALSMTQGMGGLGVRARAGEATSDSPGLEQFVIGGTASPYFDRALLSQRIEHMGLPFGAAGGRRFGMLTVETPGPVRFYHDWIVAGEDDFGETLRVLGGEFSLSLGRLSLVRLPELGVKVGASHVFNGPARNATFAYVGLSVQP